MNTGFIAQHVSIALGKQQPDLVDDIGTGATVEECFEHIREDLRKSSQTIIGYPNVPDVIVGIHQDRLDTIDNWVFTCNEDNIVVINGEHPEMDFYTVKAA